MTLTVAGFEVLQTPLAPPGRPGDNYLGLVEGTTILPKGHQREDGNKAFEIDTIWERGIPVPLRDGTVVRADVFRPIVEQNEKVPALIAWSPYGRSGAGLFGLQFMPGRAGVPKEEVSGYEKFEGPDPAVWVPRGYALVDIDARGVYDSESDAVAPGTQEGRDGHDAVEYIAQLPWCSGKTAITGNSWLAVASYEIAAQQPPHLTCIAPLEGFSDQYREDICRGGIARAEMWGMVVYGLAGRGLIEDAGAMLRKYPNINDYWEDKRVDFSKVKVPAYILASYSTQLHTEGSLRCFQEVQTEKWLTIHDTQEWHDLYAVKRTLELREFFDYYLKGIDNGWKNTPQVRVSLLGYNRPNMTDVVVPDFPLPSTEYLRLYLSTGSKLSERPLAEPASSVSYQSDVHAIQKDNDTKTASRVGAMLTRT